MGRRDDVDVAVIARRRSRPPLSVIARRQADPPEVSLRGGEADAAIPPHRHCEEQSDMAIQGFCVRARPCRPPALVRHGPVGPRDDGSVCHCEEAPPDAASPRRHCEERRDAAIQEVAFPLTYATPPTLDCHAPAGLAMTSGEAGRAMMKTAVIARRRSRRGNPGVLPSHPPTHPTPQPPPPIFFNLP